MLKSKVKKWHLLLGLFFLLKCNLKVARGGDAPQCTSTECKLGEIYPVPGEDDTQVKPQKDCYQSGDLVYYKCYGNLIGRTQNTCQRGSWEYLDGPVCIADCHLPTLDNGITIPSVSPIKDGKQIEFICNRRYTLVGVSASICEDGEFDPPQIPLCYEKCSPPVIPNSDSTSSTSLTEHGQPITVTCNSGYSNGQTQSTTSLCNNGTLQPTIPFCYAQCNKPMIPNSNSTSPNPLIEHGGAIVVRCDDGYSNGESETTTSVCNDGILDPVVPSCYAQCERPDIPNSDSTLPTPGLKHGDNITVTCNSGYSSDQGESMTAVCTDGTLNPTVPYCFAQCTRPLIPDSDATSSIPAISHGDSVTVTCNTGYSNGQIDSLITTSICNHGTIIPAVPLCYAQCQRPMIPNSDATMPAPVVDHRGVVVVTCDAGYSNGQSQGTTSVCNDGILNPSVPSCYAQCNRPVIPNSDATSFTPVLDHGNTLTVTCAKGYSTGETQSSTAECVNGTLNPTVPLCYAQCNRPMILNSNATSSAPVLDDGDSITVTCNAGYSNGQTQSTSSRCHDGTLTPDIPICYAKCSRPMIPNSDSFSSAPSLHHGDALTVTCETGYSDGKSRATTSTCDDGTFDPPFSLCYPQCNRPVIPNSDATSAYPVLDHGEELTVTCNNGYSNGHSVIITTMCNEGTVIPAVPACYEQCNRPVIQNSDATSMYPPLDHGDAVTVTCYAGYSNGHSMGTTTVCNAGVLAPPVPGCYAQCARPVIPSSDATLSNPALHHGDSITVTCNNGYSSGKSQSTTSLCDHGTLNPAAPLCYAQCNRPVIPNSDSTSSLPALNHREYLYVTCNTGYSNGHSGSMTSVCNDGSLNLVLPFCYAQCNRVIIPNSDSTSSEPSLNNGDVITVTCNIGFSNGYSDSTTSVCSHGTFIPSLPYCYAKCSRPIIPNSDATSSSPTLHHDELLIITCNTGYSNWQSQTSTTRCADGELKPDVSLCYAQCSRPVIPNSDSTSSVPVLHNGDTITVTCDNGYSNGKSKETTSLCDLGILDPTIPPCYAQCSRPVIPNSDATCSNPVLHHGDVIIVKCNDGYSNGQSQSATSECNYGSLNPTVLFCFAQCTRPVIANSDASSPYPLLDHGKALTITCDTGYSNGQSRSMTAVCADGIINLALQLCYAQCSRQVIPNSDSTSSSAVHHGEVIIVTCDEGYSSGQGNSTSSACNHGILSPPLPTCYADCKSLKEPEHGEILYDSNHYSHRGVAVFNCDGNYTLFGDKEIYCYNGLWDKDPPECKAHCNRPVITNSDAMSPNPLVPHGIAITVACNNGYTNGDTTRTTLLCEDGTLSPDEPRCIEQKMEGHHVASISVSVISLVVAIGALAVAIKALKEST